jgi:exodeoxyribonuclease V alpha subunit
MQTRNNYEKEVFNGDIGRITAMDEEMREVTVTYDGVPVPTMPQISTRSSMLRHIRAQEPGSEYPAVILPLLPQHYLLLSGT